MKRISYQRITYLVTHNFLDEVIAKGYLYLEDKLNNINFEGLSLVDKIFVVMCVNYRHKVSSTKNYLKREYFFKIFINSIVKSDWVNGCHKVTTL